MKRVLALAAHPDDIEFQMAGTLVHLANAGFEVHVFNVANGSCGSASLDAGEIAEIRTREAAESARRLGAVFHPPMADDLAIFYEPRLLARIGALFRQVAPSILLLQSPEDYMEDHQNAARLGVTAAFARGMRNFVVSPDTPPVEEPVTIYHAQPHGNRDPMRRPVLPDLFVDVTAVMETKRDLLLCHKSQADWLDRSQGMGSYVTEMERLNEEVGQMSGRYRYAEGWRRRLHLGFCNAAEDPLAAALGSEHCFSPATTESS